jgi:hypothetical protein
VYSAVVGNKTLYVMQQRRIYAKGVVADVFTSLEASYREGREIFFICMSFSYLVSSICKKLQANLVNNNKKDIITVK